MYFIGDLVKELKASDVDKSQSAIEKADAYLQSVNATGFDHTLVNTSNELISDPKTPVCFITARLNFVQNVFRLIRT